MIDLSGVMALLPLAGAGFGVGFLVGLTGVGGGALMTPLLISSFGVPPSVAVGTDLLYASVTKTVGGWRHHVEKNVDWPIVLRLAMGSLPASLILLAIVAYVPLDTTALAAWIRYGLAFALPVSAVAVVLYPIMMKGHITGDAAPEPRGHGDYNPLRGGARAVGHVDLGRSRCHRRRFSPCYIPSPSSQTNRRVGHRSRGALTLVAGAGHLGLGHVDFDSRRAAVRLHPGHLARHALGGRCASWLLRPLLALTLCYAAYALLSK